MVRRLSNDYKHLWSDNVYCSTYPEAIVQMPTSTVAVDVPVKELRLGILDTFNGHLSIRLGRLINN